MIKSILQYALGNIVILFIGIVTTPIVTRFISPEQFGRYSLFSAITLLIVQVTPLGLEQSYVRFYYEVPNAQRQKLLYKTIKLPFICSVGLAIICFIFRKPISLYLVKEVSFWAIFLLATNIIVNTCSRFLLLQIRMEQNAKRYTNLIIIQKLTYLLLILGIFSILGDSYLVLAMGLVLSNCMTFLLSICYCLKNKNCMSREQVKISLKELIKYGLPIMFALVITYVFQIMDKLMLNQMASYEELGLYSGALSIVNLLVIVQGTFTTFWTPVAQEHYIEHPMDRQFFSKACQMITVVMLISAISLILCKDFIGFFLGREYKEAIFVFPFLVMMPIMLAISETTVVGIYFMKKSKCHIYISIISVVSNFCGNFILVPVYGAKGAAIATGISYLIYFSVRTFYSLKYYPVKYYLGKMYFSIMLIFILAGISSYSKTNAQLLIIGIFMLLIIMILYKNTLKEIFKNSKIQLFH